MVRGWLVALFGLLQGRKFRSTAVLYLPFMACRVRTPVDERFWVALLHVRVYLQGVHVTQVVQKRHLVVKPQAA
jgi:hypothetical protein